MKKLILVLVILIGISLPFSIQAKNLTVNNYPENLSSKLTYKKVSNTYVLVFEGGKWWIYEYNEEGGLINIYPAEE